VNLTGRPIVQKQNHVRARRLLDLAHEMPCMAAFPHACNESLGCHPAHSNWQAWGKGVHLKATDWAFAAVCGAAHRELDGKLNPTMSREARQAEWLNAFIATHDWLWREKRIRVS
jgi:hypothetical protein